MDNRFPQDFPVDFGNSEDEPEKEQVRQEGPLTALPQPQNYYQDQYKHIADAEGFYFQDVLNQYNFLVNYDTQSKIQSEINLVNQSVLPNTKTSTYSELKKYSDNLKFESASEFVNFLNEKDPTLSELYVLIIRLIESINKVRWIRGENSKYVNVQSVEAQFKLINQFIDHAISWIFI
ncbi:MAG: hypothetical protein U5K79_02270 [Cyclobacteriaceae bacterium]|nr:hypothetical protein [Cyclobacteriaceae bacterium]